MNKIEIPAALRGPLGGHRNYLAHIAFENFVDYDRIKKEHSEKKKHSTSHKYKEFRLFLNAAESFNNVLDYFYFEFEQQISPIKLKDFKSKVHEKHPMLSDLNKTANAYKHCVRYDKNLPKASDLQNLTIKTALNLKEKRISVDYDFIWPNKSIEENLNSVWKFWIDYHNKKEPEKSFLNLIKAEYPTTP